MAMSAANLDRIPEHDTYRPKKVARLALDDGTKAAASGLGANRELLERCHGSRHRAISSATFGYSTDCEVVR